MTMAQLKDIIDKLLTEEGKKQVTLRLTGDLRDIFLIQSSMNQAEHFMEMAKSQRIKCDKEHEKLYYRQAMLYYEKAGVFSQARNIARILGDTEMEEVYLQVLLHTR